MLWGAGRNQQGHWRAGRSRQGHWRAGRSRPGALESWTEPAGALEGAGEEQAWKDAGKEQAREGAGEERALENLKPPQGWTGPAGTTERAEGASRTPAQSPSHLSPPPCPAVPDVLSAPPTVQGAELHSTLTPSTAGSLVVGIVAGSRT